MTSCSNAGMPKRRRHYERKEITRHGKTVWYFRRPGQKRIRLPDAYGSPEYLAAYERCLATRGSGCPPALSPPLAGGGTKAAHGSLSWLVGRYQSSGEFAALAETSRTHRAYLYSSVCKESGSVQISRITRKHMQDAMDRRAATPHAANNFLSAMSVLFGWAVKRRHMLLNPCDGVARRKDRIVGHHTWTLDEVNKFRAYWPVGSKPRLALDLLLLTGLRVSDAARVGPKHVLDGVLSIATGKTGITVHLPVLPELASALASVPEGSATYLTNNKGEPFATREAFGVWFKRKCKKAGLPHCSAHGLRKAGATIAAESGATVHQLMAMYGWARSAMAEVYTKAASRKLLARSAAALVEAASKPPEGPHLPEPPRLGPENRAETIR